MNEVNKSVASRFLKALGEGDITTLKTLVTDDIVAIAPGTADICGTRDYEVIMAVVGAFRQFTRSGIEFRILNLTAEGDRVACEADGYATMINGKEYNNHYHFLMFFRDGKICRMKEYFDTKLADTVLGPYLPAAAA
jgi:ketosteroid isomerase-like protein